MTTDDQKRIRIAEFCGWRRTALPEPCKGGGDTYCFWVSPDGKGSIEGYDPWLGQIVLPDYLNSLDAIAQAEARLTDEQWDRYCELLGGSLRSCASATAAQRAEALLKIIT